MALNFLSFFLLKRLSDFERIHASMNDEKISMMKKISCSLFTNLDMLSSDMLFMLCFLRWGSMIPLHTRVLPKENKLSCQVRSCWNWFSCYICKFLEIWHSDSNVNWVPALCHMLCLCRFTEIQKESSGQAFSLCFCGCLPNCRSYLCWCRDGVQFIHSCVPRRKYRSCLG